MGPNSTVNLLSSKPLTNSPLSDARLSSIVEGAEASFVVYGRVVRVIVSAEALREYFGASEEPTSWLVAFDANSALIERAAKNARASRGKDTVVLQRFDSLLQSTLKKMKAR